MDSGRVRASSPRSIAAFNTVDHTILLSRRKTDGLSVNQSKYGKEKTARSHPPRSVPESYGRIVSERQGNRRQINSLPAMSMEIEKGLRLEKKRAPSWRVSVVKHGDTLYRTKPSIMSLSI
ncbi:hypothetical protein NDU88_001098 [Pleurodeles waltl]|uniref:Uncharacterized protein n=1 Tax=Pleurodeles waltl TaxID=8319 RepID=A0AAV7R6V5_PLEWA|nr:hypothetical protein NDU88_001098 [Pleurodeles waltl]